MEKVTMIQEADYLEIMSHQVSQCWQQRNEGYLKGKDENALFWVSITSPNHTKAIVIVNGRSESAWKYQELFYEFFSQGYDVYSFDHRGQGLSDRVTDDILMGHVEFFSDYVEDMSKLIDQFALDRYERRFILAHSMGGAISTRYVQMHPKHPFHGIVLSAPMFGINMPLYHRLIAPYLTRFMILFSKKPKHITKHRLYLEKPFDSNPLTSSQVRYKWFKDLYKTLPKIQLAGPSAHWLRQGILGSKACITDAQKIDIPLLLLQASDDIIVSNQAQNKFINKLTRTNHNATLQVINGGKHEILFESDQHRNIAVQAIYDFLQRI